MVKKKRDLSKSTIVKFNKTIKETVTPEKLQHFMEVSEIINDLISDKKIFLEEELQKK